MVLRMMPDHISQVVEVHMISFKGFFLTFLGERFLKLYYSSIVKDQDGVALVYLHEGKVIGFVSGFIDPSNFYARLWKKNWPRFGIASLPAIFKDFRSLFRILRGTSKPQEARQGRDTAELSSLAVLPHKQRQGIGKKLTDNFINDLRVRNVRYVCLTTDALDNEATNMFYSNYGFSVRNTFETPQSRMMNEYWYEIK
jgi:ribosomal protein S18 acetylase RimI-like enzyme